MTTDPWVRIKWRTDEGGTRSTYLSGSVPTYGAYARDLGASVEREGELWHVTVCPEYELTVDEASATLDLDLAHADALYLNGYNSWTDSWERDPREGMRGLWGMPRAVIDRWVLDSSGDYRFARQDPRGGHQHGDGYGYLRRGRDVILFGDVRPDTGVTAIYEDLPRNAVTLAKEGPNRKIAAGERVEVLALAVCEGGLDQAFGRFVGLMGVSRRPARPLAGYSSWYRHFGDISAECLARDLDGVARVLTPQRLAGVTPLFQVDDGYAKVGDWTHPDPARFPGGMAPVARAIQDAGLLPGLWMAPFVCERDSVTFAEHPDWLLRDGEGRPVMSGSHWSGGYALDTQKPAVREHVREALSTATERWGFRFLKLDFLYAAAMEPHAGKNRGELMADALDLLRESVPEGTLFDLCGVPVMSAFGRSEYCRIGCDVGLDWDDKPYMRLINRERVSTKRSLHNTQGRAHLNGVVFLNDPDVFFLRSDVRLTDEQRARLLSADSMLSGMLLTSDDMGSWDEGQLAVYRDALTTFVDRTGGLGPAQGENDGGDAPASDMAVAKGLTVASPYLDLAAADDDDEGKDHGSNDED